MAARDAVLTPGRMEEALLADPEARAGDSMDEASFRSLYGKLGRPLLSYIRRLSGDTGLAEDLLQEVFVRVILHPVPRLDESQTRAYLYKIATRLVYDHWRRKQREKRWSFIAWTGATQNAGSEPALSTDIERVFQRLKPQERALLWLAYVEEYEHSEIARILGLKDRSVRVLLFRARKRLSGMLKKRGLASNEKI